VNSKNLILGYRLSTLEELVAVDKLPTKELSLEKKLKSLENLNPCSSVLSHINKGIIYSLEKPHILKREALDVKLGY
jgi:hypothetical protein